MKYSSLTSNSYAYVQNIGSFTFSRIIPSAKYPYEFVRNGAFIYLSLPETSGQTVTAYANSDGSGSAHTPTYVYFSFEGYGIATINDACELAGSSSRPSDKAIILNELSTYNVKLKSTAPSYSNNQAVRYIDLDNGILCESGYYGLGLHILATASLSADLIGQQIFGHSESTSPHWYPFDFSGSLPVYVDTSNLSMTNSLVLIKNPVLTTTGTAVHPTSAELVIRTARGVNLYLNKWANKNSSGEISIQVSLYDIFNTISKSPGFDQDTAFVEKGPSTSAAFGSQQNPWYIDFRWAFYTYTLKNNFNVTFNMMGHGDQMPGQVVAFGGCATEPSYEPSSSGYEFDGWYRTSSLGSKYVWSSRIIKDTVIYAKWTATQSSTPATPRQTYTQTIYFDGILGGDDGTVGRTGSATSTIMAYVTSTKTITLPSNATDISFEWIDVPDPQYSVTGLTCDVTYDTNYGVLINDESNGSFVAGEENDVTAWWLLSAISINNINTNDGVHPYYTTSEVWARENWTVHLTGSRASLKITYTA